MAKKIHHETPNKSKATRSLSDVDLVVIHYTASHNCLGSVAWFKDPNAKVSAHWIIGRNGDIHQFEDKTAILWHAGLSWFEGRKWCNRRSVGIELVGNGSSGFTPLQYDSLFQILKECVDDCQIVGVVGHEHIAPGRKVDPGEEFDWKQLRRQEHRWIDPDVISPIVRTLGAYPWDYKRLEDASNVQPESEIGDDDDEVADNKSANAINKSANAIEEEQPKEQAIPFKAEEKDFIEEIGGIARKLWNKFT